MASQLFVDSCDSIMAKLKQANADLAQVARAFDEEFDRRYNCGEKKELNVCEMGGGAS